MRVHFASMAMQPLMSGHGDSARHLAVQALLAAVDLKHGDIAVAVDLVAGRVLQLGLAQMAHHLRPVLEEHQVVLCEVQLLRAHVQLAWILFGT